MMDPQGCGRSTRISEGLLQESVGRKIKQFSALRFQVFVQSPSCLQYMVRGALQDVPAVAGLMAVDVVNVFALLLDDNGGAAFHTIAVPRALPLGDRFKFVECEGSGGVAEINKTTKGGD